MRNPPHPIPMHVHSAHKAGATPEEMYQVIDSVGGRAGGAARQNAMEAWRRVFRPDLPTIERGVELTDDAFARCARTWKKAVRALCAQSPGDVLADAATCTRH